MDTRVCPACGNANAENAQFCRACGAPLAAAPQQPTEQAPVAAAQPVYAQAQPVGQAADYAAFVGPLKADYYVPRFEKMNATGDKVAWNWCSFFFPAYWMIYRKMYLWGILMFILPSALVFAINMINGALFGDDGIFVLNLLSGCVGLAVMIVMGLFGNYVYKLFVDKKLREMGAYGNPAIAGGTNGVALGIAIFVMIGLPIIFGILFSIFLVSVVATL